MKIALFIFALSLTAFLIVGTADFREQIVQYNHYTDMVCSGAWPDYRDMKPTCDRPQYGQAQ